MLSTNKVKCADMDLLMSSKFPQGMQHFQNVVIKCDPDGCLHVNSRGGPLMEQSVAGDIMTCGDYNLWLTPDPGNKQDTKKKIIVFCSCTFTISYDIIYFQYLITDPSVPALSCHSTH